MQTFLETPVGSVPLVRTDLKWGDRLGTIRARIGFRMDYKVVPGLYGVGQPGPDSPVLVTANYKLTFDILRSRLAGVDAWLLVVDTDGVNVWCAAGKGTFSTEEVAARVLAVELEKVVSHMELVLPQLGATGVSAYKLSKLCGFKARFGPVRADDIRAYLDRGMEADKSMRAVSFPLSERMALAPVEVFLFAKYLAVIVLVGFVLSGIGPAVFSLSVAWGRGLVLAGAAATGTMSGAVLAPALLPWLPGRSFFVKGGVLGAMTGGVVWLLAGSNVGEGLALVCLAACLSSFLTMNFTGSTPYTSPSGVEKEMRRALPLQGVAGLAAIALWLVAPFL